MAAVIAMGLVNERRERDIEQRSRRQW